MAFNNGYPINYPQLYPQMQMPMPNQQVYQQQVQPSYSTQAQQTYQQAQSPQQTQDGGFVPVPSEDFARSYPVRPGTSVTLKNENAPYIYTKTMGFSQLDRPIFEKYKLVKEDDAQSETPTQGAQAENVSMDELLRKLNMVCEGIEQIKGMLDKVEELGA